MSKTKTFPTFGMFLDLTDDVTDDHKPVKPVNPIQEVSSAPPTPAVCYWFHLFDSSVLVSSSLFCPQLAAS